MVAITATTYATPSAQSNLVRARLEQARNEADRAEADAKRLRDQADQAEQQAQQGQAKVGALTEQVAQTDATYTSQLRKKAAVAASRQVQQFMAPVAAVASNNYSFPSNPLTSPSNQWASANQKFPSGRLLNLTA